MKKSVLLSALSAALFLTSTVAQAQIPIVSKVLPKVTLGVKVGANFQELNSSSNFANSYKGGVVGGLFIGVSKNKIGVQVEGLVKTVKYSVSDAIIYPGSHDINTIYLDVPVLLEYKLLPRIWLQLGPQFSSLLSAKNNSNDVKNQFNTTDFSGVLGLQAILPLHFVAGARYILGFSDVNGHNSTAGIGTEAWHNRSFQIYAGWRLL
jgi:hypothetical protein